MELLRAGLKAAQAGRPQLVLVQGEAGIGKTRLLREFAEAAGAGSVYVRFREDEAPSFAMLAQTLTPLLENPPAWVSQAGLPASLAGSLLEPDSQRDDALRALSRGVVARAGQRVVTLCVDDLHWAGPNALDLIERLVFSAVDSAERHPVRLMLVAAHRPPERDSLLARAIARLAREEICERIELRRLNSLEVNALLRSAGIERLTPAIVELVAASSRGNPFLVLELASLVKKLDAADAERRWLASAGGAQLQLPPEFSAPTMTRLEALAPDTRRLLVTAAALGFDFSADTLAAASSESEAAVAEHLDEAVGERLVIEDNEGYQFEHPLVRAAIYASLTRGQKRRLHGEIAERLEQRWGKAAIDNAPQIARHLLAAGASADASKILEFARRAGDIASAAYSWTEAAAFYQAAMAADATTGALDDHDRAELWYRWGFALHLDGDHSAAVEKYDRAIECLSSTQDKVLLAKALRERLNVGLLLAAPDVHPVEEFLASLGDEPEVEAPLCAYLAETYLFSGNPDLAVDAGHRSLRAAERTDDKSSAMYALTTLGRHAYTNLSLHDAWRYYSEALRYVPALPDRRKQVLPVQRAPLTLLALGRLQEAESLAREGRAMGRESGAYGGSALASGVLGSIAVLRGDFALAERHCQEGKLFIDRSAYQWAVPPVMSALAAARYLRGATAEAIDAIDIWLPGGRGAHSLRQLAACYGSLARSGKPEAGDLRPPLWRRDMDALPAFCAAVELADIVGGPPASGDAYQALQHAAEEGLVYTVGAPFLVPRILGLMAAADGRDADAHAHFEAALEVASKTEARVELAHSHLDFARFLSRKGEYSPAAGQLQRALPLLRELELTPLLRLAEPLGARLGLEISPPETDDRALSYHEAAVLERFAEGRGDKAIAESLALSPETVRSTLRDLQRKVGLQGLAEGETRLPATAEPAKRRQGMAVILFTDIVDSVALNERLGDRAYHDLIESLHQKLRADIEENGGGVAGGILLGDGLVATFDSASQAIAAALQVRRTAQDHQVDLHIGLHAGDILWQGDRIAGGSVNVAARIRDVCPPGEILTSATIRELAHTSSGVQFEDLGEHRLKGLAEARRLYAVRLPASKAAEYPDRLSEREVEVLRLLAQGKSNQEIAEALVISINTVLRHVSNIFAKTGAANRTEASAYAHRHNLAR